MRGVWAGAASRSAMADPSKEGPPVSGQGHDLSPLPRTLEAVSVAPEWAHQPPSTRKAYTLKWKLFYSWYVWSHIDLNTFQISSVLEFLQDQCDTGLAYSTLKVYAISVFHTPLPEGSVGQHPLILRFPCGTLKMRPLVELRIHGIFLLFWKGCLQHPLNLLCHVKCLSLKVTFLFAVTSLRTVGDLQALPVAPGCIQFVPGDVQVSLHAMV